MLIPDYKFVHHLVVNLYHQVVSMNFPLVCKIKVYIYWIIDENKEKYFIDIMKTTTNFYTTLHNSVCSVQICTQSQI